MARQLRIEFAGAIYHVTSRGNARLPIILNDADRTRFVELLGLSVRRFNWRLHAYCLMDNHYHLLIETVDDNLSFGMKYLNGTYSQYFNRSHNRVGHVFQGRFKAILVEKDSYLLELCRYVVLNPVRADMVRSAKDWPWSSYRATSGLGACPNWLSTDWVLSMFGRRKSSAIQSYRKFVSEGKGRPSPWSELKNQIFLGSDSFVEDAQCKMKVDQSLDDIPALQKSGPIKPLEYFANRFTRNEAMARAYLGGGYTLQQVGEHFNVSYATVSRAVKAYGAG